MKRPLRPLLAVLLLCPALLLADGPADNLPDKVRRIPPPGLAVPEPVRAELAGGVAALGADLERLRADLADSPRWSRLLPDVMVFHKAVDWALRHDEFFHTNQFKAARALLEEGRARAAALRAGRAPWLEATGAVARGYLSRIDGSVQPYGLVVPPGARPARQGGPSLRLDFWFHGRGETLTELEFLTQRNNPKNLGEFAPDGALVLHPYGRYCNGSRFAGETDAFEALDAVRADYAVDERRLVVRGFSLGGASAWHFAAHHAPRWAAAAPGAGFSETADFLKVFQNEQLAPAWWEQKLWRLHDAPDWIENFRDLPLVAYSGELDRQKQAADIMAAAYRKADIPFTHVIGPQTAHKYHPDAKRRIHELIDTFAARGRDPQPTRFSFVTYTTRYHRFDRGTIDALEQHWEPARVSGETVLGRLSVRTTNVAAITFEHLTEVVLDGQPLRVSRTAAAPGRPPSLSAVKRGGRWRLGTLPPDEPRKRHGLQGPIDDAFMDSFLVVRPTGEPLHPSVGAWTAAELAHMTNHWRQHYRGDARVKDDTAITDDDLARHHLILFGDPQSNRLLGRLARRLAIRWTADGMRLGATDFPAAHHALVCIQPNPLSPGRYVVLNSGFTFREYDYLNNARQTPKLPDYAVIDVNVPMTSRGPGGIRAAGFFGEDWRLDPSLR
ncbi:MAG: hypothetical protein RJA22_363 [Verrucomicrobiota bacterium]